MHNLLFLVVVAVTELEGDEVPLQEVHNTGFRIL